MTTDSPKNSVRSADRQTSTRPTRKIRRIRKSTSNTSAAGALTTITARDLQLKAFPALRFAVNGLLAEGATLLAGKPKIGKSWLALDFAMAVATGGLALGSIKCRQGPVLYCALEDNLRRLQRRMRQVYGSVDDWPADLHFATEARRLRDGLEDDLRLWIEANRARFVIIDTFAAVRPLSGRDGYQSDYAALSPLQVMAGELGASILVIHHERKLQGDDPFDSISGTTGLTGAVDAAFVLSRGKQGVTLYGRGRDIEQSEQAVEFVDGRWKLLGDAAVVRRSDERNAILDILENWEEPMGPKEIADALGKPENNIKQLLHKMLNDGEVRKVGRGRYCIAEQY